MKRWIIALLLGALLPAAAAAQQWEDYDYENLEFRGLGLEAGAIWPASVEPTLTIGLRADLGFVGPQVRIVPSLRYWSSSLRDEEVDRLASQIRQLCERQAGAVCPDFDLGAIDRSDLEISADAHYLFPTGYTIEPYLGAGLGLHLLNGSGEAISDTFVEDLLDSVDPALNFVGGVNVPLLAGLELVGEARAVLVSGVRSIGLVVGASWTLPAAATAAGAAR